MVLAVCACLCEPHGVAVLRCVRTCTRVFTCVWVCLHLAKTPSALIPVAPAGMKWQQNFTPGLMSLANPNSHTPKSVCFMDLLKMVADHLHHPSDTIFRPQIEM